jgi:hypothetical protein
MFSVAGLYVRAKQNGSTIWKQKPYDMILFLFVFAVASVLYDSPAA